MSKLGWRYQPVIRTGKVGDVEDLCVSLATVWTDEDGVLDSWTEDLANAPIGNDIEDLCGEIAHMWISAMCWKPVMASELRPGLTFERTVSQKKRDDLAAFIERGGSLLRLQ